MKKSMTSRERVLSALNHQEPDRVPIDIGGSSVSTIIGDAYENLKACLGIESKTQYMKSKSRSAILDERIAQRLSSDTRPLIIGKPDGWDDIFFEDGSFQDEFQVIWHKAEGGHYAPVGNPLKHISSFEEIDSFAWPDPLDPGRIRGLRAKARSIREETEYAVVLSLPLGVVHLSQYLRGFQEFLIDTILQPELLTYLLDRCLDWWCTAVTPILEEVDPYVDAVLFGDDVAFQTRPMMKMETYRELIKPRHKKIVECINSHSRAKIIYHCDGAITSLLDEFIEIGFDAINPVQISAHGMDATHELKDRFGERICFWGGIDTSWILPHGTPQDVRIEVRRRIHDMADGGGFVLASVHNIQEDVPAENILAMADAALEFGNWKEISKVDN